MWVKRGCQHGQSLINMVCHTQPQDGKQSTKKNLQKLSDRFTLSSHSSDRTPDMGNISLGIDQPVTGSIHVKTNTRVESTTAFPLGTGSDLWASPGDLALQPGDGRGAVTEQGGVIRRKVPVLKQSLASTFFSTGFFHGCCFSSTRMEPAGVGSQRCTFHTFLHLNTKKS